MNKNKKDPTLDEAVKYAFLCRNHAETLRQSECELKELRKSGNAVLAALEERKAEGKDTFLEFKGVNGETYRLELSPGKPRIALSEGAAEDAAIAYLKQHDFAATCVKKCEKLNYAALSALKSSHPHEFSEAGFTTETKDWLALSCDNNKLTPYGK